MQGINKHLTVVDIIYGTQLIAKEGTYFNGLEIETSGFFCFNRSDHIWRAELLGSTEEQQKGESIWRLDWLLIVIRQVTASHH